jgi:hypothetical protein
LIVGAIPEIVARPKRNQSGLFLSTTFIFTLIPGPMGVQRKTDSEISAR